MEITKGQILTAVLVALIILSVFQTYQLKALDSRVNGGGTAYAGSTERPLGSSSGVAASSVPAASSSSEDFGSGMVGGC